MAGAWFNKHSLNFKLNIGILICLGLVSLGVFFFISEHIEPIIATQIERMAQKSVDSHVKDFTHLVIDTERVLQNTKNSLAQIPQTGADAIRMLLNSTLKTVDDSELTFSEAWVYTFAPEDVSTGTLYLSTNQKQNGIQYQSAKISNFYDYFPWFTEVPKAEKIYWSEPYQDKAKNIIVITCLIPFKFMGQADFDGLIGITVDLSDIHQRINSFSFYEAGKLLLVSRSGLYVTHTNPDIALKMTIFELAEKLNLPQLKYAGEQYQKGYYGKIVLPRSSVTKGSSTSFYAPIKHIGWGLFLVYSSDKFLKPLRHFQLLAGLFLLVIILILFILINRICHHATTQLINISHIAMQYGNGDFSKNFEEKPTSSDISIIANALANMRTNFLNFIEQERKNASDKQKAESELEIAKNIQKSALNTKYPEHNSFKIATLMLPAKKVGGDFYDFFFIDKNKFAIVIADVSGKGIPAALYMMKALTLIKNISLSKKGLDFVFQHVNEQLCEGNDTCMFVTAFMAVIDINTGQTSYLNAGHNPPLKGNTNGYQFMSPKKNIVLGINPNAKFYPEELTLSANDHLFLYTDGVTEAENNSHKFYGEERLLKILKQAHTNPKDNINMVLNNVKKFTQTAPQSDDITMLDFVFLGNNLSSQNFKASITELENLLTYLKQDMAKHKISEKAQFNMVMIAEEIFANIVSYAYSAKKTGQVEIKTGLCDNKYYVTFIDQGKKYDPTAHQDPDIAADIQNRDIGGLGIFIAKKLADEMSYSYQQKKNILKVAVLVNK